MSTPKDNPRITQLFGVYNADATLIGEASYWIGARLGIRNCSLCDITHSLFTEKSEWQQCVAQLEQEHAIVFKSFHRDDQPQEVKSVLKGKYPAVVACNEQNTYSLFMSAEEIDQCKKLPQQLLLAIIDRAAR